MMANGRAPVVGILGVGQLGTALVDRLVSRFNLALFDTDPARRPTDAGHVVICNDAAELLAITDIVLACLPSAAATLQAVRSFPRGADSARASIFVNLGSAELELAGALERHLAGSGLTLLAAPVSGSVSQAKEGTLSIFASGPRMAFDMAKPVMAELATDIFYFGESIRFAQIAKLINNYLSLSSLAYASDAAVAAVSAGVPGEAALKVLNCGMGSSRATAVRLPEQVLSRRFNYGRQLGLAIADLESCRGLLDEAGMRSRSLVDAVIGAYRQAADCSTVTGDVTEVIRPMETAAGVTVSKARSK